MESCPDRVGLEQKWVWEDQGFQGFCISETKKTEKKKKDEEKNTKIRTKRKGGEFFCEVGKGKGGLFFFGECIFNENLFIYYYIAFFNFRQSTERQAAWM